MSKKLLTISDLYNFCLSNNFSHFSSSDNGNVLVVQAFGNFESTYDSKQGLMPVKLKACHIDLNRNNSYIREEVMLQALPSFQNRPILANVIELDDGTYDFRSHDYEIIDDPFNEGEERIHYIERPIGIIPESCNATLEYDEEMDKTYVVVDGYIYEDYGNLSADILKNKETSRVSVELCIEEMSFNAKEKYLSIDKFYFNGVTILGKLENGTEVGEGMLGSKITIGDFSSNVNLSIEDFQETIIDKLSKLEKDIHDLKAERGGNEKMKFNELLTKYNKTVDDIDFNYEGLSDDELVALFAEKFDDGGESTGDGNDGGETEGTEANSADEGESESEPVAQVETGVVESTEEDEDEDDTSTITITPDEKKKKYTKDSDGNVTIEFEISHEDIRAALYSLISGYEELDNKWYYISAVYDESFIMESWGGAIFGQKYKKDGDSVSLDGDRYALHREYLTDSELAELNSMRSNYSELVEFKTNTLNEVARAEKLEILNSEDYSILRDNEDFKALIDNVDNYTVDIITEKADLLFAREIKKNKQFSANSSEQPKKPMFLKYGLGEEKTSNESSYLAGLLKLNQN